MKYSPLQIKGCYFTEVKVSANPNSKEEDASQFDIQVETDLISPTPENKREWLVLLKVKIKPRGDAVPNYVGEVESLGRFEVAETWPESQTEKLVYTNGSGLLYSATREMLCNITARCFWDMISLPTWSFSEMYKELEAKRAAAKVQELPLEPSTPRTTSS